MDYPKKLKELVLERSKDQRLTGFVNGQGSLTADLMLIGEAPGRVEVETLIPFTGQSGKKLDEWLKIADLSRDAIYITSAVRSRPYKRIERVNRRNGETEVVYPNRTPNQQEIFSHAPLLDYEISQIKPKILAPMGNIGLQRLLGKKKTISSYHGKLMKQPILQLNSAKTAFQFSSEVYFIFPLYHPAAVLYNHRLTKIIQADWQTLSQLMSQIIKDDNL